MANMVPDVPFLDSASFAERKVYDALKALPDDYRVFHSVTYYLWPGCGAPLNEGEADFVILHPSKGLLVLEVKGGRIRYEGREQRWYSTDRRGVEHSIDDPFRQAQRCQKALAQALEPICGPDMPHGHAVCFPDCEFLRPDGKRPLGQPEELILDARAFSGGLENVLTAVYDRIVRSGQPVGLSQKVLKKAAQNVLAPRFALGLSLKTAIAGEETAFVCLASEQVTCLDFLELNPRAVVEGGAGTGKTLVAVEAARRLASRGSRVLLLCFNRPLAAHLRSRCADLEPGAGSMRAATFHELCRDYALRAGLPWPDSIPTGHATAEQFYNETAPGLLREALGSVEERFDAVLVDEAQDFPGTWWPLIDSLLVRPGLDPLFAFLDPSQDLWDRNTSSPMPLPRFPLRVNQRNTAAIARHFAPYSATPLRYSPLAPEGDRPVELTYSTPEEERRLVEKQLDHLLRYEKLDASGIVILGTHHLERSFLGADRRLCGFPVEAVADDGTVSPGALRYSTPRRFKGLEADVVLLCDVDGVGHAGSRRDLYVSMSRARHRLYIFLQEGTTMSACPASRTREAAGL